MSQNLSTDRSSTDKTAPPHALEAEELVERLQTDLDHGLTSAAASRRLAEVGPNRLSEVPPPPAWTLFATQFRSPVILVLLGAAIVSGMLDEWTDAAAIAAIVVLNASLGFVQEFRAERALAGLKRLVVPQARVIRDGTVHLVASSELVPGDLVVVEAGDRVPADARVIYAAVLRTSEAALTGESTPVTKVSRRLEEVETPVADRRNMLFLGTEVVTGKGRAVVVETGARTELGRIALLIGSRRHESTPLERRLTQLAGTLLVLSLGIVALVFVLGVFRGEPALDMFLTAVSLAVAAIPEGLPAMVTITLALGVTRMARRHALVRRLSAVETLGSTSVICVDKTGTLTRGEMHVQALHVAGTTSAVEPVARMVAARALLETAVLCSDANLVVEEGVVRAIGDSTETALLQAAAELGLHKGPLEAQFPITAEIPFDPVRKRMIVVRRDGSEAVVHVKGAIDVVLPRCSSMLASDGTTVPLDSSAVLQANEAFARRALRVLAIARRRVPGVPDAIVPEQVERDLVLLGLAALADPLRDEVPAAVAACRTAGIRVVMITGDHQATAAAIASQLGLLDEGRVLSGAELDRVDDRGLEVEAQSVAVYARVTAEHKLRIVRALRSQRAIVAMTGDGVNDAPALQEADVGIAMGLTGTDVAKDAADMVVTDDNFASIVAAVEEGRSIYANIQRGVQYLLSCNLSEILLMLLATLTALPLPLLPVQILWTNLVTDGLPALALAIEPRDPDAMHRPPRDPRARFVDRRRLVTICRHGLFMAVAPLLAYAWQIRSGAELAEARGLAFCILVFSQLSHALNSRHERASLASLGLLSNPALLMACGSAAIIQVAIMTIAELQPVFGVGSLSAEQWGLVVALGLLPIAGMETEKWLARRSARGAKG